MWQLCELLYTCYLLTYLLSEKNDSQLQQLDVTEYARSPRSPEMDGTRRTGPTGRSRLCLSDVRKPMTIFSGPFTQSGALSHRLVQNSVRSVRMRNNVHVVKYREQIYGTSTSDRLITLHIDRILVFIVYCF